MKAQNLKRYAPLLFVVATLAFIYRGWLARGVITYGDWGYYSSARMRDFWPMPTLWQGLGMGTTTDLTSGPMFPLLFLHGALNQIGIGFAISERFIWIFPGVLIGALSIYVLAMTFFASRLAAVVSALFIVCNSYIAVIVTGGQLTVGTAYLLMPLILLLFYRALIRPTPARIAPTALAVSVQIMYDLRSTYLTLGVLLVFAAHYLLAQRSWADVVRVVIRAGALFASMGLVALLIHSYWLVPGHYAAKIALPAGYDSTDWVFRLSYMRLSHAFALFHPFWYQPTTTPYVGSVSPIYFLVPLIIFAIFLRRRLTFVELFLFSTALLAIFFVKGDNAPGGMIYDWFFKHFPGFSMYRDPSKFYQPLALVYALLLGRIAGLLYALVACQPSRYVRQWGGYLSSVGCVGAILLFALPVATNTSWGTLAPQPHIVPKEYLAFNHYIDGQSGFFRTMWYPNFYPFASDSGLHPAIGIDSIGPLTTWSHMSGLQGKLRALSVKYVVVGDDPTDTSQDKVDRAKAVRLLHRSLPTFKEIRIGRIHLFLNPSYLPSVFVAAAPMTSSHARALLQRAIAPPVKHRVGMLGEYSTMCDNCFTIASRSPTRYEVTVHSVRHPFLLVLDQSFDPNWVAYVEPSSSPQPFWWTWTHSAASNQRHMTVNGFANAWLIDAPRTQRIVIEYWPQRLADVGWGICWLTIIVCLVITTLPLVSKLFHQRAAHAAAAIERAQPFTVKGNRALPSGTAGRQSALTYSEGKELTF